MSVQLELHEITPRGEFVDPIHTTFTGGGKDRFNRWYPYLEGFSPEFVRTVLEAFSPKANTVLDPFGGTATTAFTAAEQRLHSFICEVNPVMQFIFDAKVSYRTLASKGMEETLRELDDVIRRLPSLLSSAEAESELALSYAAAFGKSVFFDENAFERILKVRTLLDELEESHPLAAKLVGVAILASLVPASLLKRAGDVRFMTSKELEKGVPTFDEVFTANLRIIASDLTMPPARLENRPKLLASDARQLSSIPSVAADTVITSPPYVNGTNYFRNTRLELWFLRCLRTQSDLRYYRERAITGGINDVTISKSVAPHNDQVEAVVRRLTETAYDSRIPMMVASYFAELTDVFAGVSRHLVPGAVVAIDIGDSIYNGVHVPADALLRDSLREIGYTLKTEIELRKRRSNNGAPLTQTLLVMEWRRPGRTSATKARALPWRPRWTDFQELLPHQVEPFAARNWGSGLHSLCSYPGKLKPAIAHHLVKAFVPEGGAMLDPFAGVGTVPFEASLSGRKAFGIDLSPAAYTVAAAKVSINKATKTGDVLDALEHFIGLYAPSGEELDEIASFGMNGKIVEFYNPDTMREVLACRRFFLQLPVETPSSLLVKAASLHLLHGNRPYAFSRRSHPLTPYAPTGENGYRSVITRLREKVRKSLAEPLPAKFQEGVIFHQDSTIWWPSEIDQLDAVITSPPFFDSTRFHMQNWLRLWFTGWTPAVFKSRPSAFVDERQKSGFVVYESVVRQAKERLKKDGVLVWHLGKSTKCDMASELIKVASRWFSHFELFDESVAHCESHGLRDKGTVTSHQYLILY
jgi:DNA modification methylase